MKLSASKRAAWLVAGVTLLIWLPAVFNNFVEWDDAIFITSNPRFNPPKWETIRFYWSHAGFNLYMPVTYTLWALLARIGTLGTADAMGTRLNPYLFHLVQVLLHVIATTAVFGILKRALGAAGPAMAGAMLFAIHPLQVESVAFIGTMNTPLAGAMVLTAIWMHGNDGKNWRWAATALYVLAILAKPTAVVAPVILILLDLAIKRRSLRQAVGNALPWLILTIPCLIWTKVIQNGAAANAVDSVWMRPLIAGDAMMFYVRKVFSPWPMAIDYGLTPKRALASVTIWWGWLVPAILLTAAWLGRRRSPVAAAGAAIFFVAMLPNSGLIPFEYQYISTTADRYVYLSMLGTGMILGSFLKAARPIYFAVMGIALAACVTATELQIRIWQDGETLFRHAISVNPQSWMAYSNLGMVLANRSPDEAIAHCRTAVELSPRSWVARNNLSALLAPRDPDEAIAQCRTALELDPYDAEAYNNMGSALIYKGERAAALQAFAKASQLAPDNLVIQDNYQRTGSGAFATTRRAE